MSEGVALFGANAKPFSAKGRWCAQACPIISSLGRAHHAFVGGDCVPVKAGKVVLKPSAAQAVRSRPWTQARRAHGFSEAHARCATRLLVAAEEPVLALCCSAGGVAGANARSCARARVDDALHDALETPDGFEVTRPQDRPPVPLERDIGLTIAFDVARDLLDQ